MVLDLLIIIVGEYVRMKIAVIPLMLRFGVLRVS